MNECVVLLQQSLGDKPYVISAVAFAISLGLLMWLEVTMPIMSLSKQLMLGVYVVFSVGIILGIGLIFLIAGYTEQVPGDSKRVLVVVLSMLGVAFWLLFRHGGINRPPGTIHLS